MMDILKRFAQVFVFAIGSVFALVGLAFTGIAWVFGTCSELLMRLALGIDDELFGPAFASVHACFYRYVLSMCFGCAVSE